MSDEAMAAAGGVTSTLADILTDVAEGRSELIYMGGAAGMLMKV